MDGPSVGRLHDRASHTGFVAEGAIDYQAAASRVRDETSQTGYLSRNAVSSQEEQGASPTALNGQSSLYIPPTQQQLFVFLRGVQWRAPDANTALTISTLSNFMPSPLEPNSTSPPGSLVAHAGVSAIAQDLWPSIVPFIAALPSSTPLTFAGHSLGGALGKIVWSLSLLNRIRKADNTACFTFGSPPVLAHVNGGGGAEVLRVLGASRSSCWNYVLENDPIPRALLQSDLSLNLLRSVLPVDSLLRLRGWFSPGSLLSDRRFVYENVGDVVLLRHSEALMFATHSPLSSVQSEGRASLTVPVPQGCRAGDGVSTVSAVVAAVVSEDVEPQRTSSQTDRPSPCARSVGELQALHLSPDDLEKALQISLADLFKQPSKALSLWLDHHYGSYTRDLQAATTQAIKASLAAARGRRQPLQLTPKPSSR
ncbi:MAG: hypothetical protein WDW38_005476 [Sanguina aurantia]